MKYLVGFPLILKRLTLNDPEMPFYVKICFHLRFVCFAFEDNYVKMNEDTLTLSATQMFASESSFW